MSRETDREAGITRDRTRQQVQFHLTEALRLMVELARPQLVAVTNRTTLPDAIENRAVEQEAQAVEYEAAAETAPTDDERDRLRVAAARAVAVSGTLRARAAAARAKLSG